MDGIIPDSGRPGYAPPDFPNEDALVLYPERPVLPFMRVSSRQQAGPLKLGRPKLAAKTAALVAEIRWRAGDDRIILEPVFGIEEGKLSCPRPYLDELIDRGTETGALAMTWDLSRYLRADAYDRRTNPEAWPTDSEFAAFRARVGGVLVTATVLDAATPENGTGGRMSRAIKRRGLAGRRRTLSQEQAAEVFAELGYCVPRMFAGGWRWERPVDDVAKLFRLSKTVILRDADRPSPVPGKTWRDLALDRVERLGLLKQRPGGYLSVLYDVPARRRGRTRVSDCKGDFEGV